jgi:hypothetical protein
MGRTLLRPRFPSPALTIAGVALFAALGGTTYAATQTSASTSISFTKATLVNGWKDFAPPSAPAGYAKDSLGVVHLRGALGSGKSGTTAFVLPRALRPAHDIAVLAVTEADVVGTLQILRNGDVEPFGGNSSAATGLDGLSFVAGE